MHAIKTSSGLDAQLLEPVPGSEMVGSTELVKREHENKTAGGNFSCAFHFRVFPTIWEPWTGYNY